MIKKGYWFALVLVWLGIDQLSKALVLHCLIPFQSLAVIPGLNIVLVFNSGSAFGFLNHAGPWHQWVFTGFSIVMSVVLGVWMWYLSAKAKAQLFAIGLILSGAIGNVIDRFRFGYVIDFIDIYYKNHHWFVFNLADSAICVGALILFFSNSDKLKPMSSKAT